MEYSSEQLLERFSKLPDDLKTATWDLDIEGAVGDIGIKYQLHIDQIGVLADHIALTIIGLEPIDQFKNNLEKELLLPKEKMNELIGEVNQQIFLPIRESLQRLHEQKDRAAEAAAVSAGVETIQAIAPDQTTDELPAKDKLLDEIENPQATKDTVFEKKLGQLFRIPREEVDLDPYLEKPIK